MTTEPLRPKFVKFTSGFVCTPPGLVDIPSLRATFRETTEILPESLSPLAGKDILPDREFFVGIVEDRFHEFFLSVGAAPAGFDWEKAFDNKTPRDESYRLIRQIDRLFDAFQGSDSKVFSWRNYSSYEEMSGDIAEKTGVKFAPETLKLFHETCRKGNTHALSWFDKKRAEEHRQKYPMDLKP